MILLFHTQPCNIRTYSATGRTRFVPPDYSPSLVNSRPKSRASLTPSQHRNSLDHRLNLTPGRRKAASSGRFQDAAKRGNVPAKK